MELNIKRAIEEIRLNDDADSHVFYLDMTDTEMPKKFNEIMLKKRKYDVLQAKIEACESDEKAVPLAKECAKEIKGIITICLGDDACKEIVRYIKGGAKIADYKIVSYLAVVATALLDIIKKNYIDPLAELSERAYVEQDKQPTIKVI